MQNIKVGLLFWKKTFLKARKLYQNTTPTSFWNTLYMIYKHRLACTDQQQHQRQHNQQHYTEMQYYVYRSELNKAIEKCR